MVLMAVSHCECNSCRLIIHLKMFKMVKKWTELQLLTSYFTTNGVRNLKLSPSIALIVFKDRIFYNQKKGRKTHSHIKTAFFTVKTVGTLTLTFILLLFCLFWLGLVKVFQAPFSVCGQAFQNHCSPPQKAFLS